MAQLPTELWSRVLEDIDSFDLKRVRRICKQLNDVCRPLIFKTIILRPNQKSLDNARAISSDSTLSTYVKFLELRAETVFRTIQQIADFMTRNKRYLKYHTITNLVPQGYAYVDYVRFVNNMPELRKQEIAYVMQREWTALFDLCKQLPSLQHVVRICGSPHDLFSFVVNRFARQYGLNITIEADEFGFLEVMPLVNTTATALSFQTISDEAFSYGWQATVRAMLDFDLSRLRSLNMHYEVTHYDREVGHISHYNSLNAFLSKLVGLKDLKLFIFMSKVIRGNHVTYRPTHHQPALVYVWKQIVRQYWPNLTSLWLSNVVCTEFELLTMVARHSKMLKDVLLDGVWLHEIPQEEERPFLSHDSVIRFLWMLPYTCELDKFTANGPFKSCQKEEWVFDPESEEPSFGPMKKKINDYVCKGGGFPLPEFVAMHRCNEVLEKTKPWLDFVSKPKAFAEATREEMLNTEAKAQADADVEKFLSHLVEPSLPGKIWDTWKKSELGKDCHFAVPYESCFLDHHPDNDIPEADLSDAGESNDGMGAESDVATEDRDDAVEDVQETDVPDGWW